MRKVTGYIYDAAIGTDEFEFYVDDYTSDRAIEMMINDRVDISFTIEEGYKEVMVSTYVKEN